MGLEYRGCVFRETEARTSCWNKLRGFLGFMVDPPVQPHGNMQPFGEEKMERSTWEGGNAERLAEICSLRAWF